MSTKKKIDRLSYVDENGQRWASDGTKTTWEEFNRD